MTEATRVLVVDDEQGIRDNIASFLERAGYQVAVADDGEDALKQIPLFQPDIVILDVLMPNLNGREVLRRLRSENNWIPVILLTQVGDSSERAMALEEGADDYLNKPFDANELVARIKAVLRRSRTNLPPLTASKQLVSGELKLDRASHRVWLGDTELNLTRRAILLLEYLMTHPYEIITRSRLLDEVWGWDFAIGERAVDTRISELRKNLNDSVSDPVFIETIPGEGYRFIADVGVAS